MSKHTPAPWWYDYEPGYCGELIAPDGTTVARFAGEPSPMDACLIAAAPELLAELIEAADFIESMGMDATPARAAIAKAIGGAT